MKAIDKNTVYAVALWVTLGCLAGLVADRLIKGVSSSLSSSRAEPAVPAGALSPATAVGGIPSHARVAVSSESPRAIVEENEDARTRGFENRVHLNSERTPEADISVLHEELLRKSAEIEQLMKDLRRTEKKLNLAMAVVREILTEKFLATEAAQKLDPETRKHVSFLIPNLLEMPSEWEIEELALAVQAFYPQFSESSDSVFRAMDVNDPSHFRVDELVVADEKLITRWNRELKRIFGSERGERLEYSSGRLPKWRALGQ